MVEAAMEVQRKGPFESVFAVNTEIRSMMSTSSDSSFVYFTSALSDRLNAENNGKAHQGLYKCSLNTMNGSCQDAQLVADRFHHDQETCRGLRLSHLSIDSSSDPMIYATYFENNSRGFEIIRGPLTSKVQFQSFFRTKGVYSSHTCNKECCPGAYHTYLVTKPASYLIDAGEVFISWAGFYRVRRCLQLQIDLWFNIFSHPPFPELCVQ